MSQIKDLAYWKANAEEDYLHVPISVLRYISEFEKQMKEECLAFAKIVQPHIGEVFLEGIYNEIHKVSEEAKTTPRNPEVEGDMS